MLAQTTGILNAKSPSGIMTTAAGAKGQFPEKSEILRSPTAPEIRGYSGRSSRRPQNFKYLWLGLLASHATCAPRSIWMTSRRDWQARWSLLKRTLPSQLHRRAWPDGLNWLRRNWPGSSGGSSISPPASSSPGHVWRLPHVSCANPIVPWPTLPRNAVSMTTALSAGRFTRQWGSPPAHIERPHRRLPSSADE